MTNLNKDILSYPYYSEDMSITVNIDGHWSLLNKNGSLTQLKKEH